jgi:hypothetical protein
VDEERRFTEVLVEMRTLWIASGGRSHAHLDALIDPVLRHDPSTRNYLASGASGSVRDRIFSPSNGDSLSEAEARSVSDRHRLLLDEATQLSLRLGLPATADW